MNSYLKRFYFFSFAFLTSSFLLASSSESLMVLERNQCQFEVYSQKTKKLLFESSLSRAKRMTDGSLELKFSLDPLTQFFPDRAHILQVKFHRFERETNQAQVEVFVQKKDFWRRWSSRAQSEAHQSLSSLRMEFAAIRGDQEAREYRLSCRKS